jgi:hypothetical protein
MESPVQPQLAQSKCVVVVAEELPFGLKANAASVITMTLGDRCHGLVGPDVKDADGVLHPGVVLLPVPILTARTEQLRAIWQQADADSLVRVGFSSLAQSCRTYEEYIDRLGAAATEDLQFVGVGLFGAKRDVNKLAGSLPLLR